MMVCLLPCSGHTVPGRVRVRAYLVPGTSPRAVVALIVVADHRRRRRRRPCLCLLGGGAFAAAAPMDRCCCFLVGERGSEQLLLLLLLSLPSLLSGLYLWRPARYHDGPLQQQHCLTHSCCPTLTLIRRVFFAMSWSWTAEPQWMSCGCPPAVHYWMIVAECSG